MTTSEWFTLGALGPEEIALAREDCARIRDRREWLARTLKTQSSRLRAARKSRLSRQARARVQQQTIADRYGVAFGVEAFVAWVAAPRRATAASRRRIRNLRSAGWRHLIMSARSIDPDQVVVWRMFAEQYE